MSLYSSSTEWSLFTRKDKTRLKWSQCAPVKVLSESEKKVMRFYYLVGGNEKYGFLHLILRRLRSSPGAKMAYHMKPEKWDWWRSSRKRRNRWWKTSTLGGVDAPIRSGVFCPNSTFAGKVWVHVIVCQQIYDKVHGKYGKGFLSFTWRVIWNVWCCVVDFLDVQATLIHKGHKIKRFSQKESVAFPWKMFWRFSSVSRRSRTMLWSPNAKVDKRGRWAVSRFVRSSSWFWQTRWVGFILYDEDMNSISSVGLDAQELYHFVESTSLRNGRLKDNGIERKGFSGTRFQTT